MLHVAQVAAIRRIAEAVYLTWAGFLFSFSWPISRDFRVQLFFFSSHYFSVPSIFNIFAL